MTLLGSRYARNAIALIVVGLVLPLMSPASIHAETDPRWAPWLGCWQLMTDEVRESLPEEESELNELGEAEYGEEEARRYPVFVCLSPAADDGDRGVQVSTVENGLVFLEEHLIADGQQHPVRRAGCDGWQESSWSSDTSRLFTRSELECDDEGTKRPRSIAGVSLLVDRSTWVEIQAVGSGDMRSVLIRRYRSVVPNTLSIDTEAVGLTTPVVEAAAEARARRASFAPLDIDDIIDASRVLPIEVLEALVLQNEDGYAISSSSLEQLSDENVHPAVIDLMVALSFPERFEIEHGQDVAPSGYGGAGMGYEREPYDYRYAYAYPYYAAPFGYYYWFAPYDPFFVVQRIDTGGVIQSRVFKNQGYARVTPRQSATGRFARRRGEASGSDSSVSSGSSAGGGGATSSASPSGYSRGGSSGRTAKPKKR